MKLFCLWCATVMLARQSAAAQQDDGFYAPQTFQNHIAAYQQGLFKPAQSWTRDAEPQPQNRLANTEPWRPAQSEPWKSYSKEQQASILHHKQTLSKEGSFRYEFASDNGVAAGEVIEPDGSRLGAFQYKDPSGQLVKLKYRAGKEGFQILEGSHLPKSPEPVAYPKQEFDATGEAYQDAYTQQRQQFQLQQQHNQQPQQYSQQQYGQPRQQNSLWTQSPQTFQNYPAARPQQQSAGGAGNQYFTQNNWGAGREDQEDDGQYRENDIENQKGEERGPHNFGEGYAFEFQG